MLSSQSDAGVLPAASGNPDRKMTSVEIPRPFPFATRSVVCSE